YDLSEEKLMKLKYKSQHGDSEASFRLYQYYCFTKNNIDKQLRFLERSVDWPPESPDNQYHLNK
ncbi:hypothetical protein P7M55_24750, partial [Vibrio parahaemolyticus]|nr:hypothetical protein [Vibrio parahaemolyticus]